MTKLIIAGANTPTGLSVLHTALKLPLITHILALTAHPLPSTLPTQKLTIVVRPDYDDFKNVLPYLDETRYDACVWCVGGRRRDFETVEEWRCAGGVYPLLAAEVFSESWWLHGRKWEKKGGGKGRGRGWEREEVDGRGRGARGQKSTAFRFVYVSAWGADVTGRKWRMWEREEMRALGRVEAGLYALAQGYDDDGDVDNGGDDDDDDDYDGTQRQAFELYAFRPGDAVALQRGGTCMSGEPTQKPGKGIFGVEGLKDKLRLMVQPRCPEGILAAALVGVAAEGFGEEGGEEENEGEDGDWEEGSGARRGRGRAGRCVFFENREIVEVGKEVGERWGLFGGFGKGEGWEGGLRRLRGLGEGR